MKSQVKFVCLFISHRPLPPRDSRRLRRNRVIPVLRSLSNVVMIITIPAVNRHDCPCAACSSPAVFSYSPPASTSTASSTHTIFFIFVLPFLFMLILACFVLLIQKERTLLIFSAVDFRFFRYISETSAFFCQGRIDRPHFFS